MKCKGIPKAWTAGLLLVAFAATTIAPAAEARHHKSRRYKSRGYSCEAPVRTSARFEYRSRHSDAVPLLAGLIGGFALGTVLAKADGHDRPDYGRYHERAYEPDYSYYDPYCQESFASLDIYRSHLRYHRHPTVVRVIVVDTGECVDTYRYQQGRWVDCGDGDYGYDEDDSDSD
jgi:hypothetical protein